MSLLDLEIPRSVVQHAPTLLPIRADAVAPLEFVGGKGRSLQQLHAFGEQVPPGFIVTTAAFRTHLEDANLVEALVELCARLPDDDARRQLQDLPCLSPLPSRLEDDVQSAVASFPGSTVFAVRSSAVAEDGIAHSFAGQHRTELAVGGGGVVSAIRRCWGSLWSEAAIAYRLDKGLDLPYWSMAVVVQLLVRAQSSAVAFSENPVNGSPDELVLCAVPGLGEPLVSGAVTPETIVVDRGTLAIRDRSPLGAGPRHVVSGTGSVEVVAGAAQECVLDESMAISLAQLCLRAEGATQGPVDIEASHDGVSWHLLQARAITTRADDPATIARLP